MTFDRSDSGRLSETSESITSSTKFLEQIQQDRATLPISKNISADSATNSLPRINFFDTQKVAWSPFEKTPNQAVDTCLAVINNSIRTMGKPDFGIGPCQDALNSTSPANRQQAVYMFDSTIGRRSFCDRVLGGAYSLWAEKWDGRAQIRRVEPKSGYCE